LKRLSLTRHLRNDIVERFKGKLGIIAARVAQTETPVTFSAFPVQVSLMNSKVSKVRSEIERDGHQVQRELRWNGAITATLTSLCATGQLNSGIARRADIFTFGKFCKKSSNSLESSKQKLDFIFFFYFFKPARGRNSCTPCLVTGEVYEANRHKYAHRGEPYNTLHTLNYAQYAWRV
jgi:hypothetical protein